jgi:hypothetical protein
MVLESLADSAFDSSALLDTAEGALSNLEKKHDDVLNDMWDDVRQFKTGRKLFKDFYKKNLEIFINKLRKKKRPRGAAVVGDRASEQKRVLDQVIALLEILTDADKRKVLDVNPTRAITESVDASQPPKIKASFRTMRPLLERHVLLYTLTSIIRKLPETYRGDRLGVLHLVDDAFKIGIRFDKKTWTAVRSGQKVNVKETIGSGVVSRAAAYIQDRLKFVLSKFDGPPVALDVFGLVILFMEIYSGKKYVAVPRFNLKLETHANLLPDAVNSKYKGGFLYTKNKKRIDTDPPDVMTLDDAIEWIKDKFIEGRNAMDPYPLSTYDTTKYTSLTDTIDVALRSLNGHTLILTFSEKHTEAKKFMEEHAIAADLLKYARIVGGIESNPETLRSLSGSVLSVLPSPEQTASRLKKKRERKVELDDRFDETEDFGNVVSLSPMSDMGEISTFLDASPITQMTVPDTSETSIDWPLALPGSEPFDDIGDDPFPDFDDEPVVFDVSSVVIPQAVNERWKFDMLGVKLMAALSAVITYATINSATVEVTLAAKLAHRILPEKIVGLDANSEVANVLRQDVLSEGVDRVGAAAPETIGTLKGIVVSDSVAHIHQSFEFLMEELLMEVNQEVAITGVSEQDAIMWTKSFANRWFVYVDQLMIWIEREWMPSKRRYDDNWKSAKNAYRSMLDEHQALITRKLAVDLLPEGDFVDELNAMERQLKELELDLQRNRRDDVPLKILKHETTGTIEYFLSAYKLLSFVSQMTERVSGVLLTDSVILKRMNEISNVTAHWIGEASFALDEIRHGIDSKEAIANPTDIHSLCAFAAESIGDRVNVQFDDLLRTKRLAQEEHRELVSNLGWRAPGRAIEEKITELANRIERANSSTINRAMRKIDHLLVSKGVCQKSIFPPAIDLTLEGPSTLESLGFDSQQAPSVVVKKERIEEEEEEPLGQLLFPADDFPPPEGGLSLTGATESFDSMFF